MAAAAAAAPPPTEAELLERRERERAAHRDRQRRKREEEHELPETPELLERRELARSEVCPLPCPLPRPWPHALPRTHNCQRLGRPLAALPCPCVRLSSPARRTETSAAGPRRVGPAGGPGAQAAGARQHSAPPNQPHNDSLRAPTASCCMGSAIWARRAAQMGRKGARKRFPPFRPC